jgi:hypothetical protein
MILTILYLVGAKNTDTFLHGGQCGWARPPPAPSSGLQQSNEGTWMHIRCCFVLSLQWAVAPFRGMRSPQAWIFGGVLII